MEVSTAQEWQFFLWSLLAGGALAVAYDVLRIRRRMISGRDLFVNVEDILFCILAAVVLFATAFLKNDGKMRWQGFIGAFAGFLFYRLTVRNLFVNGSVIVLGWLTKFLFAVLRGILFPVMLIYKLLRRPFTLVAWYSRKGMHRAVSAAKVSGGRIRMHWRNTKQTISKK